MKKNATLLHAALVGAAALVWATGPAAADNGYYDGKDIELLVPYAPGGGNDTFARLLQSQYRACMPEAASVQVVNVPGGGTVIGANEFELMREPDGMTIMVTAGTTSYAWMLGQPGVRYSPRNWTAILGLPGGGVVYVNPDTGVREMKDLVKTDAELVFGGISATGLDLLGLLTFEILDLDVKAVLGYEGKGPAQIAYQQGEINIDYQTTPAFIKLVRPQVEAGTALPLYTAGMVQDGELVRDPAFPDFPSFLEAYRDAYGKDPSGPAWEAYLALVSSGVSAQRQVWMHKDTPPEALAAMKAATECVIGRDEFYTQGEKILAGYKPIVGAPLERNTKAMLAVSDDVLKWLRGYLNEKYDLELSQ
jgi:tripartite-type tricarboxylate transporter receptor subunit TctC